MNRADFVRDAVVKLDMGTLAPVTEVALTPEVVQTGLNMGGLLAGSVRFCFAIGFLFLSIFLVIVLFFAFFTLVVVVIVVILLGRLGLGFHGCRRLNLGLSFDLGHVDGLGLVCLLN